MLLSLSFKNIKSYREENNFSLICPNGKIKNRYPDNFETISDIAALKTAVIIGENAGGKSNFIFVLEYLKYLFSITDRPIKSFSNLVFYVNKAIVTSSENIDNPETLEKTQQDINLEVVASDGLIYHYYLEFDCVGIKTEKLTYRKNYKGVEKVAFSFLRKDDFGNKSISSTVSLTIETRDKKTDKMLLKSVVSTGLIANSLSLIYGKHIAPFVRWIKDSLTTYCSAIPLNYAYSFGDCDLDDVNRVMSSPDFIDIFRLVDSSIVSIDVDKEKPFSKTVVYREIEGKKWPRTIEDDSSGVKQFLALSYDIYRVIFGKKVFFADELDSMLNPILTMKLINYIHSFADSGQFIFTSHNVTHLNLQLFMKDQMFIVEKDKKSLESSIYSVADFKELRYDSNQKLYEFYMNG